MRGDQPGNSGIPAQGHREGVHPDPGQLTKLLEPAAAVKARGSDVSIILARIMFGAFGGLRTSEIQRLRWKDILLEEEQLYVLPGKTVNAERWVVLTPPLLDYCQQMLKQPREGAVLRNLSDSNMTAHKLKVEETAGIVIPDNALRHSYGSHHLVEYDNSHNTATEMGHYSPQQTFAAYSRAVTKSQAKTYWELRADL